MPICVIGRHPFLAHRHGNEKYCYEHRIAKQRKAVAAEDRNAYQGGIMPYEAKQDGDNWVVINTETEEVKATHEPPDAEEKAKRQVRLLDAIEHDEGWNE